MSLPMRNIPSEHGIRVPFEVLQTFVTDLFKIAGMPVSDAELLSDILTRTDLRCVYSHGTQQTAGYIKHIQDGAVNPSPVIHVVEETNNTVVLDGDGGMGYFPSYKATKMAIEKAKAHGVGVATTCNHFHFGAAGTYSRMAMDHDCIGFAVSSHRYPLDPDRIILGASGGSPMSIAIPSASQPPFVLDMSSHVISPGALNELFEEHAAAFVKSLGLGIMFQMLGGILAGIWQPAFQPPESKWLSNQGAFIAVFNIANFRSVEAFKQEVDTFIREARQMKPIPGMTQAELPGGMEWQWEKENRAKGIPISDPHRQTLETVGETLGMPSPFPRYEDTRF